MHPYSFRMICWNYTVISMMVLFEKIYIFGFDNVFQVHGGPKGDVCLGKLKCHHYICISCFSDVKFHSKCQICHKSFKKNDIKFEYLSPNSNWILPISNFQKFLKKTARCGQKWIFESWSFAILTADVLEFFLASWINWYSFIFAFWF